MDTKPIQLLGLDDLDDTSLQNQSDSETFPFHDTIVTNRDVMSAVVTTSDVTSNNAFHNAITSSDTFHADKPLTVNDPPLQNSASKVARSMKLEMPFLSTDMMPLFDDSQDSMDGFTLPGLDSGTLEDLNSNTEISTENCSQQDSAQGLSTEGAHSNEATGNVGTLDYIDIEELQSFIKSSSLPDGDLLDSVHSDLETDLEKTNESPYVADAYQGGDGETKDHNDLSEKATLQHETNLNNNSNSLIIAATKEDARSELDLNFDEMIDKNVSVMKKEGEAKKIILNGSRRKLPVDIKPKPVDVKPKIVGPPGGSDSLVVQTAIVGSSLLYKCPHCERTFQESGHIKQHLNNAHKIHNEKKVGIHLMNFSHSNGIILEAKFSVYGQPISSHKKSAHCMF